MWPEDGVGGCLAESAWWQLGHHGDSVEKRERASWRAPWSGWTGVLRLTEGDVTDTKETLVIAPHSEAHMRQLHQVVADRGHK